MSNQSRFVFRAMAILLGVFILFGANSPLPYEPDVPEIIRNVNDFSMSFLRQTGDSNAENGIVSPQSIYHCLGMSYVASGGNTRKELAAVIRFPEDNQTLLTGLANLRQKLLAAPLNPKTTLSIDNSMWLDGELVKLDNDYLKQLQNGFGVQPNLTSFKNPEKSAKEINDWVAEKTKKKIPSVVSPDDLKPSRFNQPSLVTVNAIYFRSDWKSRFSKEETTLQPFWINSTTSLKKMLMHQKSHFSYAENPTFKFLEMPYAGDDFSMCVILPKQILNHGQLVSMVNMETLRTMRISATPHIVDVLFPVFELRQHYDLGSVLRKMGVIDAFVSGKADFRRMTVNKFPLYIKFAYHDAIIKVDEEGTEAAAVTTVGHFGCGAPPEEKRAEFHANRPFLFFIIHRSTQSILFAGWMSNPNTSAQ